jgi:hypothetical protein
LSYNKAEFGYRISAIDARLPRSVVWKRRVGVVPLFKSVQSAKKVLDKEKSLDF